VPSDRCSRTDSADPGTCTLAVLIEIFSAGRVGNLDGGGGYMGATLFFFFEVGFPCRVCEGQRMSRHPAIFAAGPGTRRVDRVFALIENPRKLLRRARRKLKSRQRSLSGYGTEARSSTIKNRPREGGAFLLDHIHRLQAAIFLACSLGQHLSGSSPEWWADEELIVAAAGQLAP